MRRQVISKTTAAAVAAFKARSAEPRDITIPARQQWTIRYARKMSAADAETEHALALQFTRWWLSQDVRSFATEADAAEALAQCPEHLRNRAAVEPLQSFGRL